MLRGIHLLRGFIFMRNLEKKKEYGRRYYIKHKKRLRKLAKIYYKLTASVQRANRKKWYKEHRNNPKYREKVKIYGERYRKKYIKQIHKRNTERWWRYRMEIFDVLGGRKCKKCGFSDVRALHIDHKFGGGSKEIRKMKSMAQYKKVIFASKERYQILCANCNFIKRY